MPSRHEIVAVIKDPMYSQGIPLTTFEHRALSTYPMRRLEEIPVASNFRNSLSILPKNSGKRIAGSRRQHSIGAFYISTVATELPETKKDFAVKAKFINAANLFHDIGTFPFSHASEDQCTKLKGKTHEQMAGEIIHSHKHLRTLIANYLGNAALDLLPALIEGQTSLEGQSIPYSLLVNAKNLCFDPDGIDNGQRSLQERGLTSFKFYDQLRLAQGYRMNDDGIYLELGGMHDINGLLQARKILYDHINSPQNMSPQATGARGLELAYRENQLPDEFTFYTDAEATSFLESKKMNSGTRVIFQRLARGDFYPRVAFYTVEKPDEVLREYMINPDSKYLLADEISKMLKTDPENVAVQMGKDKGHRRIQIPIIIDGKITQFRYHVPETYSAQIYVYLHGNLRGRIDEVRQLVDDKFMRLTVVKNLARAA